MGGTGIDRRSTNTGEGYHVLVVDDDRALATVVAESLEHVDSALRTSYTSDPWQALSRLRRESVDCLVTDLEMPDLDGLSLVDEDDTDTPFVVFTQCSEECIASDARARGGAYLQKGGGREQYSRLARLVREQLEH